MSSRSTQSDPQQAASDATQAFANMSAAGMDMFQDWLKAASGGMGSMGAAATPPAAGLGSMGGLGKMGAWGMPTLDPEELDKRIQDLRTVQFWLEQNARMIAMTIQGLEVQKMTLSTLKGMNVSMDALRDSLKARNQAHDAAAAAARQAEPPPEHPVERPPEPAAAAEAPPTPDETNELINPMRWWDTLTQQFTHLAAQAAQPMAAAAAAKAKPASARKTAGSTAAKGARTTTKRKTTTRKPKPAP